eukprot:Nk52_evm20s2657 gene=Nk52_evmTU20s2657
MPDSSFVGSSSLGQHCLNQRVIQWLTELGCESSIIPSLKTVDCVLRGNGRPIWEYLTSNVRQASIVKTVKGNLKLTELRSSENCKSYIQKISKRERLKKKFIELRKKKSCLKGELISSRNQLLEVETKKSVEELKIQNTRASCTILRSILAKLRKESSTQEEYVHKLDTVLSMLADDFSSEKSSNMFFRNFKDGVETKVMGELRACVQELIDHHSRSFSKGHCEEPLDSHTVKEKCINLWKVYGTNDILEGLIQITQSSTKELIDCVESGNLELDAKQLGFEVVSCGGEVAELIDISKKRSVGEITTKKFDEGREAHLHKFFAAEKCRLDALVFQKDIKARLIPDLFESISEQCLDEKVARGLNNVEVETIQSKLESLLLSQIELNAWMTSREFLDARQKLLSSELAFCKVQRDNVLQKLKEIEEFSKISSARQRLICHTIKLNGHARTKFAQMGQANDTFKQKKVAPTISLFNKSVEDLYHKSPWSQAVKLLNSTEPDRLVLSEMPLDYDETKVSSSAITVLPIRTLSIYKSIDSSLVPDFDSLRNVWQAQCAETFAHFRFYHSPDMLLRIVSEMKSQCNKINLNISSLKSSLLDAGITLESSTTSEKMRQIIHCSRVSGETYLSEMVDKCEKVNENTTTGALSIIKNTLDVCTNIFKSKAIYFDLLNHWWKQPGQFGAPTLTTPKGLTFPDAVRQFESMVNQIRQLQPLESQ